MTAKAQVKGEATKSEVRRYFQAKANSYDDVDLQAYWRLSDALLWRCLEESVVPQLRTGFRFLDAGAGTGRWADRICRARDDARGTLVDLTPEMLAVAESKARRGGYRDRVTFIVEDLDVPGAWSDGRYELVICFHNVLGFAVEPTTVIRRLAATLAPGGLLVLMLPNAYHAAFFNLARGDIDEADRAIAEERSRFTDTMPYVHVFTPDRVTLLLAEMGLVPQVVTGFPCLLYPGVAETQLHGSTGSLDTLLEDDVTFARLYELERAAMARGDVAARGNNLFVVARGPAAGA